MKQNATHSNIYGKTIKLSRIADLNISENTYQPDLKVPKHSHEHAYFCLVLQGSYEGIYGRSKQRGKSLDVAFRPSDEPHSVCFHKTGARLFSIEVKEQWLKHAAEYGLTIDRSTGLAGGNLSWLAVRLYKEIHSPDSASPLAIEGLFLEMLAETARHSDAKAVRRAPRWLEKAREILHARFADELNINEIAAKVGVHPVHLATVFRTFYRCTIGEYIRSLRIQYACRKIAEATESLAEIALSAGFFDQSHFSKTFKQITGMAPGQFRSNFHLKH